MNILSFHKKLLDNYRSYINSFINIKDPSILEFVNNEIDNNKLWLEPLIQFNPTFEKANPLKKLVTEGKLNKELDSIFEGYDLYRHQEDAILLGSEGKEFVVTSGTGSGNRVASTYIYPKALSAGYVAATHYSYDIHGNVKTLIQENRNTGLSQTRIF